MIQTIHFLKIFILGLILPFFLQASETFTPYSSSKDVPVSVVELWDSYNPSSEELDTKVINETKENGVISRYVTYRVGTFKGVEARVAAYYTFPDKPGKHPAFVWTHGGGQRAEKDRGIYFAKQGYAVIDINWLGRSMEKGVKENTDWGKVDPTLGPRFYPKALRQQWKRTLIPDEYSIDPVPSPRNSNWFLLAVAGKRGITFLEQQPEVDANRIGFAGFSMGGVITAMNAIDPRLKAVVPFVGGSGFNHQDLPEIEGSSQRAHYKNIELYRTTVDVSSYWPRVQCPVAFLTSSNDFHSPYERIQKCMNLLSHKNYRISANMHRNHGPDPEQWVLLNLWFDRYLKGKQVNIPPTPSSLLEIKKDTAHFSAYPQQTDHLIDVEIYYSYDPNARTRFWKSANAIKEHEKWSAQFPIYPKLPLYAFALCRYNMIQNIPLQRGESKTFTLNSVEQIYEPPEIDLSSYSLIPKTRQVDNFSSGVKDWAIRENGKRLETYKFQDPSLDLSNELDLTLGIDPQGKELMVSLKTSSSFVSKGEGMGKFQANRKVDGKGERKVIFKRKDFTDKKEGQIAWSKIGNFSIAIIDLKAKHPINLADMGPPRHLKYIEMISID